MQRSGVVMKRGRKQQKHLIVRIFMMSAAACLLCCTLFFLVIKTAVEPNLGDVAGMRAEVLVSRAVNKALAEQFSDENRPVDIFRVQKGENGAMELVQADSVQINVLMTELSMNLQKAFREMELEK